MNTEKIDLIIQYALSLASSDEDFRCQELGPIHFIKYVYLADLAFAQRKKESFTGIRWQFHNFGPWSNQVFQRIEPALNAIGAEKKMIPSSYSDDDYTRWAMRRSDLTQQIEKDIHIIVYGAIRTAVKTYSNDTTALLHHVYQTLPMLTAAPGEELNLFAELPDTKTDSTSGNEAHAEAEKISNNEKRRRLAKANELKFQIRNKISKKIKSKTAIKSKHIEYNDVFARGVEWLDNLAGQPMEEFEGVAEIAPTTWKSPARFDPDVS